MCRLTRAFAACIDFNSIDVGKIKTADTTASAWTINAGVRQYVNSTTMSRAGQIFI